MTNSRHPGRPLNRSPWVTAVSIAGTAALLALAIGAPVAVAATRGADSGGVVTVDPTVTATTGSAGPTDAASPAPTDSATPSPSPTPTPTPSVPASPTPAPSSSSPGTPLESSPATGTLTPDTQVVKVLVGTLMEPTTPYAVGGDFTDTVTYAISPALPNGLWFSAVNGTVHGTPEMAQAATDYTVIADDGTVRATATITLAIVPDLRPIKVVASGTLFDFLEPSPQLKPIGFPDLVANPVTYSVDPALPKGIDIDPKTGIVSGYAITLEKATSFVITGTDGTFAARSLLELTTTCPTVYTPQPLPDGCPAVDPIPAEAGGVSPMLLAAVAASTDPVHGPLSNPTTAETCSLCHRTHSAKAPGFLGSTGPTQTALCFTCHNGTGGGADVQAQFAIAPPNVVTPTSRSYYSHDVAEFATKAHQGAIVDEEAGSTPFDEFGGVENRHAECSDCHNPHASYIKPPTTDVSTETPNGWTASGRIYATSGVKADYTGLAPGAVPAFTLLDGVAQPLTAEYQLCFKCHSSYTTLPSNAGMDPTSMIYDQSVEFNPANPSFHPVAQQGKNQTTAMKASLRNASGSQLLWNFETTDTIRCTNCHAQPSVSNANGGAGQVSAPHGSYNKYILLRRYEASTAGLSSPDSPDFDLCFGCHSKSPFVNEGSADTNWGDHYLHSWEQNLRCAECHGEIHSTTNVAGQVGNSRLIKFGPDVAVYNAATPLWSPLFSGTTQNGGTCALVCHGKRHTGGTGFSYRYTP